MSPPNDPAHATLERLERVERRVLNVEQEQEGQRWQFGSFEQRWGDLTTDTSETRRAAQRADRHAQEASHHSKELRREMLTTMEGFGLKLEKIFEILAAPRATNGG